MEIARVHLRRGDRVALLARRSDGLDAASRALSAEAGRVWLFAADVRDASMVQTAIQTFTAEVGPVARLYFCVGAFDRVGPHRLFDRDVFDTNIYGAINTVEAWVGTSPRRGSAVGIISSFSAFRGLPPIPAYGASKAALTVYAESLRGQLRTSGLGVTTAFLGYFDSAPVKIDKPNFMLTTRSKAAEVVVTAVERGATEIAYPPLVRAAVLAQRLLPNAIYDRLVAFRYRKSRLPQKAESEL